MRFAAISALVLFIGGANAHFRLLYPGPRGPFNGPNEVEFCGGYTEVTNNRTAFPLSGGFFSIKQGHPDWKASVLISTEQDPNSFNAFNGSNGPQFALRLAEGNTPGNFCFPLNLSNLNISGVRDGANVTLQVILGGGDGSLYQCADLTLSSNYTIPENIVSTCQNSTSSGNTTSGGYSNYSVTKNFTYQVPTFVALFLALCGSALAVI